MANNIKLRNTQQSHDIEVIGVQLHYVEVGYGDPILFLHGVPTSSYIWRNIFPYLAELGRCIAPDLVGFGASGKPSIRYSINDHIKFINAFIEKLKLKNIILVMHGWGSIIGFNYAMQHEANCKGLVFYEAFLRPLNNDDISLPLREQMMNFEEIDQAVVNGIPFVDRMIPQMTMYSLDKEIMQAYREPFLTEKSTKPILQYLYELPRDDKSEVNRLIKDYSKKLTHSSLPKLMLYSLPGFITTMATAMWAKEHLPHLEIADIGEELHLAQEVYPQVIGETISVWLQGLEQEK